MIRGYVATVDHEQMGLPLTAFVSITPIDPSEPDDYPDRLRGDRRRSSRAGRSPATSPTSSRSASPPPAPSRTCSPASAPPPTSPPAPPSSSPRRTRTGRCRRACGRDPRSTGYPGRRRRLQRPTSDRNDADSRLRPVGGLRAQDPADPPGQPLGAQRGPAQVIRMQTQPVRRQISSSRRFSRSRNSSSVSSARRTVRYFAGRRTPANTPSSGHAKSTRPTRCPCSSWISN